MFLTPSSPRISYTTLSEEYLDTFYALAQDLHVRQFLMEDQEINRQECSDLIAKSEALRKETGLGLYLIYENQTPIGYCGFMESHSSSSEIEVLFAFPKNYAGRGMATEVCKALVTLAPRTQLNPPRPLTAVAHPQKQASIRVLEKCGFTREDSGLESPLNHLLRYRLPLQTPF